MEIEKQVAHNEVQEMIPEIIEISEQDCITKYESEILSTNSDDVILGSEKENQRNCTAKDSPSKELHETFLGNNIDELDNILRSKLTWSGVLYRNPQVEKKLQLLTQIYFK